jgi:hypothetical protein
LIHVYGGAYEQYRLRVPMLIPFLRRPAAEADIPLGDSAVAPNP